MKPIEVKISDFKAKQLEVRAAHAEFVVKEKQLLDEYNAKADAMKAEFEEKNDANSKEFRSLQEKYKAEVKATFGITDGEKSDILSVVEMVQKVLSLQ
jgi:hypothetical protein